MISGLCYIRGLAGPAVLPDGQFFTLLLLLMAVSGAGLLGFIGLGLQAIVLVAHPVQETFSSGLVEWWMQVFGAIIPLLSGTMAGDYGFRLCAVLSIVCAVVYQFHVEPVHVKSVCSMDGMSPMSPPSAIAAPGARFRASLSFMSHKGYGSFKPAPCPSLKHDSASLLALDSRL